jgi:hypothetical protein
VERELGRTPKSGEDISRAAILIAKKFGICIVTAAVLAELAFELGRAR